MASAVMTPEVEAVLKSAAQIAMSWNHHWVGTEHLLLALIGARAPSSVITASLTYEATEAAVKEATPPLPEREVDWGGVVQTPRVRNILGIAEGWALAATWPDQATIDLTSLASPCSVKGRASLHRFSSGPAPTFQRLSARWRWRAVAARSAPARAAAV